MRRREPTPTYSILCGPLKLLDLLSTFIFLTYQTGIFMRTFLLFQSILQVSHFSFAK